MLPGRGIAFAWLAAMSVAGSAGGAGCPQQLVTNGDFETGTTSGWTYFGGAGAVFSTAAGDGPCGPVFGTIQIVSDPSAAFYQDVSIPAGASSAALSFQWRVAGDSCGFAYVRCYIKNPLTNATLATVLAGGCCTTTTCTTTCPLWSPVSYNALAFSGQNVRLWFEFSDDVICPGEGFYDCISLLVCIPSPTVTRTRTVTPTPSRTRTVTVTITGTPTGTASETWTETVTETPTPSNTTTASPTVTPTAVDTATSSETSSRSATATATSSRTPTVATRKAGSRAFPNPVRVGARVRFTGLASGAKLTVYNVRGERLGRAPLEPDALGTVEWRVERVAPGVHVFIVREGSGVTGRGTLAVLP